MPPSERGLYEPSDDVRVFDAAEDDEEEEGSRLPLLIVLALLVLGAFGGVVWLAYKQGEAKGRGDPITITADAGPAKVAPTDAQTGQTPNQGLKIYEQPAPADENAEPAQPQSESPQAPGSAGSVQITAVPSADQKPPAAAAPKPVAETPAPKAAKPAPVEVAPAPKPALAAKPTVVAATKPAPVPAATLPPPTKPAPAPATVASAPPRSLAPPATAPTPAASTGGGYQLQLGAFASQSIAESEWRKYQAKQGTLLTGFTPNFQAVDPNAANSLYRLRIGGIANKDAAVALCDRIKTNGGNCYLVPR